LLYCLENIIATQQWRNLRRRLRLDNSFAQIETQKNASLTSRHQPSHGLRGVSRPFYFYPIIKHRDILTVEQLLAPIEIIIAENIIDDEQSLSSNLCLLVILVNVDKLDYYYRIYTGRKFIKSFW
jgi:hypothetical protein